MTSAASPPSPGLRATRSRPVPNVPALASLASFASPAPHDSCNAMRSGAVRCNPDDAAMTQPVTQTRSLVVGMTQAATMGFLRPRPRVTGKQWPVPIPAPFRARGPTFARVAFLETNVTSASASTRPARWATGPTCQSGQSGAAGTVVRMNRVSFACPDFRNAQRGNGLRVVREDE